MTGKIFLSYRRKDEAWFAVALYRRLEQSFPPQRVFMDVEGGIAPGQDFVRVLEDQVSACDVMLVLIGAKWLTATDEIGRRRLDNPHDFVRIEIESALRLGKWVIPVLVDKTDMPRAEALPEPLKPLARRNAVGLVPERFNADAEGLIKGVERALAEVEAARRRDATAAAEEQRRDAERVAKTEEAARSEKEKTRLEAWNHEKVFLALEKRGEKIKDSSKKDIYVQLYKQDTNCALLYRQDSRRYGGAPVCLNPRRSDSWNKSLFHEIEPYIVWVKRDNKGPGKDSQNFDHYRVRDWDGFAAALGLAPRTTTGDTKPTAAPAPTAGSRPILTPPQERLLSLLAKYQAQFAVDKLIVGRDGNVHFDNAPNRGKGVNLVRDLYDSDGSANQTKFEQLVESLPPEYLRVFPENRWDSPFVVAVTDAGLRYLLNAPFGPHHA